MADKAPEFIRINYLRQRREFDKIASTNILSRVAEVLYSRLFYLFNEHGQSDLWQKSMQLKNRHVAGLVDIDVSTLDRVRRELVDNNLIRYTPGVGSSSGHYELVILYNNLVNEDGEPLPAPTQQDATPPPVHIPHQQEPPLAPRFVRGLSSGLSSNLYRTGAIQKDIYISKPSERENPPASSDYVQSFLLEVFAGYDTDTLKTLADNCYRYYASSGWVDSIGRDVVNWKAKAISWVYRENAGTFGSTPRGSPAQSKPAPPSRNYTKEEWDKLVDSIDEDWS